MNIFTRLLFILLSTGLLFSLAPAAFAARSYLVELVVFSNQYIADTESWSSVYPPLNAKKMSRAIIPGQGELKISDIHKEIEESVFSKYVARINNTPERKILLSTRWVQPVLGSVDTSIARITDARITDNTDLIDNARRDGQNNQTALELPQLDGFIHFYLNNQYTLEADIRFTPPYRPSILDEGPDIGPVSYRIHEKRRIKSGELNYYDHPSFGMVLLVTQVKAATEQEAETN